MTVSVVHSEQHVLHVGDMYHHVYKVVPKTNLSSSPALAVKVSCLHKGSWLPFADRVLGPYSIHVVASTRYEDKTPAKCVSFSSDPVTMRHTQSVIGKDVFAKKTAEVDVRFTPEEISEGKAVLVDIKIISNMAMYQDTVECGLEVVASPDVEAVHADTTRHYESAEPSGDVVHIIAFSHGLNGTRNDLHFLGSRLMERIEAEGHRAHVFIPTVNQGRTREGLRALGERFGKELFRVISKMVESGVGHEQIHLSMLGYSLGGLITRYAMGYLAENHSEEWGKWRKVNYFAVVSPLAGSREGMLFIRTGAHVVMQQTGKDLMISDSPTDPILVRMSNPDSVFFKALSEFENRQVYANVFDDPLVGYCTSALRAINPYTDRIKAGEFNNETCVLIDEPDEPVEISTEAVKESMHTWLHPVATQHVETILRNLNTLTWKRVAVYIKAPVENAHRAVVVRREGINLVALAVVEHIVSSFHFD